MNKRLLCTMLLVGFSLDLCAATFKWTDANGQVHYGDRPSAEFDSRQISTGPTTDSDKQQQATTPAADKQEKPSEQPAKTATNSIQQKPDEQDKCEMLKAKFEKYKKGLIDFSTVDEQGRKFTPAKVKVIKAYEDAIAGECS